MDLIQLLFIASTIAWIFLMVILVIRKQASEIFSSTPLNLMRSAFGGFLNPFLYYMILLNAYKVLPAQIAGPINYTWPVMLVLLSVVFLHQKIKPAEFFTILISFTATKAVIATPISNEEFAKISSAKDFKAESIISTGEKKFQIRDTISGQGEVETFGLSYKRITDAKAQLQQLIDLQPKLTNDADKKKVEKAIKEIQDDLSHNLDEFKKARGFDFNAEAITLPSEARLSVQITEEEKKAIEAKAPTSSDKK